MIPYGRQWIDDDDVAAVAAALRSDRITQGARVEEFEASLARSVGARHAVAFANGSLALHAAGAAAGIGPGDTVATSALTFIASANCARAVGATPVLVDIDPTTLNLDVHDIPACDALVVVHYAGLPVDLSALAPRPRVVIEDAAHALGARTPDGPVGNCACSDLCVFSFHPVKAITTGEGGAVTTNSEELAARLRRFRNHGIERRPADGGWAYTAVADGVNGRLTDFQAALGESQLAKLGGFIDLRNAIADRYRRALEGSPVQLPPAAPTGWRHAYHLFPVQVAERRRVYDFMQARGVGVQVHYVPLSRHPVLASAGRQPRADLAYERLLSLPIYPALTDEQQDDVIEALLDAVGGPRSTAAGRQEPRSERKLTNSQLWWGRATRVIPAGTQTLSKSPNQYVQGSAPLFLTRGRGAHVWDVDGNRYLDYPMALGPVILGYAEPAVDDAIRRQLDRGITFTLMHPLEVEVAERIVATCPGVEAVRFAKSGSDALTAAVRAARAVTGRDLVLTSGYHGWHDWYIGSTTRRAGVPGAVQALTHTFAFNDIAGLLGLLDRYGGEVAAVVVEPSGAEIPVPGFLDAVVESARAHGAVSVFDEVITGFRLAPGGARQRYGVIPDVSCYGKALGNGMPISATAGAWEVMRAFDADGVFFSQTHGGETLSLAAALAVLDAIADGSVLTAIEELGRTLRAGMAEIVDARGVEDRVRVSGEPQRTVVTFPQDDPREGQVDKSWVQQCFGERGILFNGSMFVCARHQAPDVEAALDAFDAALAAFEKDEDVAALLTGAPVGPVFRGAPA